MLLNILVELYNQFSYLINISKYIYLINHLNLRKKLFFIYLMNKLSLGKDENPIIETELC